MNITTLGIDIAKNVFQLHGVDQRGKAVLQKRLTRTKLLPFLANLPACRIGMEACGGAHYWARAMSKLGHEVKLIATQFVKPYVQGNKTDKNDAAAICEAVSRPHMRFVAIKTLEQQDVQTVHRLREQLVKNRTATANQLRGILAEYGIVIAQGLTQVRRAVPPILEEGENGLSALGRELIADLYQRLCDLDGQVKRYDERIAQIARQDDTCQRLQQVEGVGPIIATAFRAAVGDAHTFSNGRQVAAWLGLVPKQQSSGQKVLFKGITKRGDRYLRKLLVHGARTVVKYARTKHDPRSGWINRLRERRGANVAAVAVANKNARVLWALLVNDTAYRPVSG